MNGNAVLFIDLIQKYNPHHDRGGRFSTADGAAFTTIRTRDASKQHLADRGISKTKAMETHKEVLAAENKIRHNKTETAVIVKDGKKLIDKSEGRSDAVYFTKDEVKKMKGAVLTHNHPNGSGFSEADLGITVNAGIKEMRAVHSNGAYSLKEVGNATKSPATFAKDFQANRNKTIKKNDATFYKHQKEYHSGQITVNQFQKIVDGLNGKIEKAQDKWLMKNSKNYGYEYTKE